MIRNTHIYNAVVSESCIAVLAAGTLWMWWRTIWSPVWMSWCVRKTFFRGSWRSWDSPKTNWRRRTESRRRSSKSLSETYISNPDKQMLCVFVWVKLVCFCPNRVRAELEEAQVKTKEDDDVSQGLDAVWIRISVQEAKILTFLTLIQYFRIYLYSETF